MQDSDLTGKVISKVKLLGIVSSENSPHFATFCPTIYSLLVFFTDNTREIVECSKLEFERIFLNFLEI